MSDVSPPEARTRWTASTGFAGLLVAIYGVQLLFDATQGSGIVRMGALYPGLVEDEAWWALLSATLLHANLLHVGANAFFVAIVGGHVERVIGAARTLVVFFAGALGGSVLSVWWMPDKIGVGASGGAWGLMLAELALVALPWLRVDQPYPATLQQSLRLVGLNALLSFLPGIDGLAHFGGGLGGLLAVVLTHRGRLVWAGLAATLGAANAGALGYALWVGKPWAALPPLGEPVTRENVDNWVTLTLPERLVPELDGDGPVVEAGSFWREGIAVVVELGRGPAPDVDRETFYAAGITVAPEVREACGPGCEHRVWHLPELSFVVVTRQYGMIDLVTTVSALRETPERYAGWDVVGAARLSTDGGLPLLWEIARTVLADGDVSEGMAIVEALLREAPEHGPLLNSIAWRLATDPDPAVRDGPRAVALAGRAVALAPHEASFVDTLAAAWAEVGDFERAVATQTYAVALHDDPSLREHLATLRAGQPIRERVAQE